MLQTEIRRTTLMTVEQRTEAGTVVSDDNDDNNSNPIQDLAAQAADLLGYTTLAKRLEQSAAAATLPVPAAEETELRAALRELEIEILNPDDVNRYMRERQVEQTEVSIAEWKKTFLADQGLLRWWESAPHPEWALTKIEKYTEPIPEFVLAKAVQIKQRVGECQIFVESLQEHPDPFLVVGMGAQRYDREKPKEFYWVECWDEPRFEGRLAQGAGAAGGVLGSTAASSDDIPF